MDAEKTFGGVAEDEEEAAAASANTTPQFIRVCASPRHKARGFAERDPSTLSANQEGLAVWRISHANVPAQSTRILRVAILRPGTGSYAFASKVLPTVAASARGSR